MSGPGFDEWRNCPFCGSRPGRSARPHSSHYAGHDFAYRDNALRKVIALFAMALARLPCLGLVQGSGFEALDCKAA